ncbi:MAG: tandem-95 repeat protein, partial [Acidobacteria bacterium]|nr:tandem-95 repeat protein [Acidobacteriota bacterium]
TLVPTANIVFGGSGASRTVTVTPAANQNGSATITVTVSDGALSASDTFTLTVTAVNDTPTISDIANQTIDEDHATGALGFTVGDQETAAASLTVSGSSSNTTLVPTANIVFGGSGASRTVTVTPAADQNGSATITVTVSDGAASASDTFTLTVTAVNDAPTISGLTQSLTITEDTPTSALTFTIGDIETDAANLTVTGKSSNVTIVPHANIVFGGSGANRTVTITPAANQSGQVTINVTVSDGTLSTDSDNLILTVTAVEDAPTISDIPNQTIDEDASTSALAFTVNDAETAASSLTLSGSSSNTTLVPTANIVFGGSGSSRTVTVTPAANQNGSATITVTVSDGTLSASDTFTLTVNAVNDPPTIVGPANQTTSVGVAAGPLTITVNDVETSAAQLTLSGTSSNTALVPVANLAFGGSGSARTITVTPAAGSVGSATITLTVSDGTSSTSTTFSLTVTSTLTLEKTGNGLGTVGTTADPSRCGSSCTESYQRAETVRLTATPDPQATFAGWSGDDDCLDGVVTMSANRTCRARFTHLPSGGPLDLNGDRLGDVFSYDGPTGNWTEWIATAARSFSPTTGGWSPRWVIRAADFDLNARSDLFLYNPIDGQWFQVLKTESSYQYINGTWSSGWTTVVADFNGDRRSDVFLYDPIEGWWMIAFAQPEGGFMYSPRGQWSPQWDVYPVELNGDRFPDLFLYNAETGRWFWVLNAGQGPGIARPGRTDAELYVSGSWSAGWQVVPADFNADRRTDFLLYNRTSGVWVQAWTSASGFAYPSGTWDSNWTVQVGDFNSDRRDDLFLYNDTTGAWVEALVDASGAFTYHSGRWDPGWRLLSAPFTPNGQTGLLLYATASGTWVRAIPTGPGTFSYVSGTFGTGLSLLTATPRTW